MSQDFKLELDDDDGGGPGLGRVGEVGINESDEYNNDSFEKFSSR